jgi:hypothetical protein
MSWNDGVALPSGALSPELEALVRACTRVDPSARPTVAAFDAAIQAQLPRVDVPAMLHPVNLDFRVGGSGMPPGWCDGAQFVAGAATDWSACVVLAAGHRSLKLSSAARGPDEFGTVMQRVPARHVAGSRLSFTAEVSAEGVQGEASLWLRIDDATGKALFFENLRGRGLKGTSRRSMSIELEVPRGAEWLNYGLLLVGSGEAFVDRVALVAERAGRRTRLDLDRTAANATFMRT